MPKKKYMWNMTKYEKNGCCPLQSMFGLLKYAPYMAQILRLNAPNLTLLKDTNLSGTPFRALN